MSAGRPAEARPAASGCDAVVVGAGPNGLSAAVALARAGLSVLVVEGSATVGGGARSAALTLPGYLHDTCSAIHPMAAGSPFFRGLPLAAHGLEWIHPPAPLAHPLDDGTAVLLERSVEGTANGLGADGPAYRRLMAPFAGRFDVLASEILGPPRLPHHPLLMARFGLRALRSGAALARALFQGERARALFAGLAAHSVLPLERSPSAAVGLVLGIAAHAVGWPLARGGSQRITDALAAILRAHGGRIETGRKVAALEHLPPARAVLVDLPPRQVARIAGGRLPAGYRARLERFRHGPGVFKVDWALREPIPWRAGECRRAATVHLGGTLEEVAAAERAAWTGERTERPFVLLAQPSLFDPLRAPAGRHTAWAYCHVPHGSAADMTGAIEGQVERFAPGFRDLILARSARSAVEMERENPNLVGGDITGGVVDLRQIFGRPTFGLNPYATPDKGLFICSASTPPGGGVHGMCGFHAAMAALRALSGYDRTGLRP